MALIALLVSKEKNHKNRIKYLNSRKNHKLSFLRLNHINELLHNPHSFLHLDEHENAKSAYFARNFPTLIGWVCFSAVCVKLDSDQQKKPTEIKQGADICSKKKKKKKEVV